MVIDVMYNIKPLITRVNNPRVTTFSGKVRIINRGRITALTTPRKMDPTIAPHTESSKAGIIAAVNNKARILSNHLITQPCTDNSPFPDNITSIPLY